MNSTISKFDSIDVVGVRVDGGLDLLISCVGDLDGSPFTLNALRKKIRSYLNEVLCATNPTIRERYGCQMKSRIRILISYSFRVAPQAQALVNDLQHEAEIAGVELVLSQRDIRGAIPSLE
ncbi:MAG: hypothetical protein IPP82_09390 [Xanthomonadales bacterium]|nr:hypothetical protein [Xanthomonadales bacterium]